MRFERFYEIDEPHTNGKKLLNAVLLLSVVVMGLCLIYRVFFWDNLQSNGERLTTMVPLVKQRKPERKSENKSIAQSQTNASPGVKKDFSAMQMSATFYGSVFQQSDSLPMSEVSVWCADCLDRQVVKTDTRGYYQLPVLLPAAGEEICSVQLCYQREGAPVRTLLVNCTKTDVKTIYLK
jgi:hypothetical protein